MGWRLLHIVEQRAPERSLFSGEEVGVKPVSETAVSNSLTVVTIGNCPVGTTRPTPIANLWLLEADRF